MVKMMGPWGEIIIAAGLIVSVCGAYLSWTIMAAEVPFLASTHKAFRGFSPVRMRKVRHRPRCGSPTSASDLHGAYLAYRFGLQHAADHRFRDDSGSLFPRRCLSAKIATRPLHRAVGVGACIYGLWLLYASGPMHLLLSVVLYAPGLLVFLYARKTHTHDNVLNRQEMVLIGLLLVAAVPATRLLVG